MALSGLSILRSGGSGENVCGYRELRCLVTQDLPGRMLAGADCCVDGKFLWILMYVEEGWNFFPFRIFSGDQAIWVRLELFHTLSPLEAA